MRRHHFAIIAVLAIVLSACSEVPPTVSVNDQVPADQRTEDVPEGEEGAEGEGGGAGGAADFASADAVWVSEGLEYTESPATIPSGGAVIGLEVVGGLPHNVVFEGFQGDAVLVDGPAEGTYAATVDIPPGTYTYYCSIVGHRAGGMEGEVTVE
jgi:plastocyanin